MKDQDIQEGNDNNEGRSRRSFLTKGLNIALVTAVTGTAYLAGCKGAEEDEIGPPEDLMREHGILNRVLLIYDHFLRMLAANEPVAPQLITASAGIIRTFIEEYHEKQEEDFLFPRFEKAHQLTDLVQVLRAQHQQGRLITGQLLQLGKQPQVSADGDKQRLSSLIAAFIHMYRPHEAREDTVLFPALRKIISKQEFDSLGEDFEKREHQLFGEGGFELFVDKVAGIEQQLGIYDLAQFTPRIQA
ncbi:hemerythrin domain-containing protein [Niabella drilacis]|uniref:Hemerythrin-like domain-containing protein n=1 Tax=Niabella drilacis (strain DSM 25811 / CCM 8410 / CCUG 62505 / LMG 26954 / E90) TaxID=1285928 RepID=A0A1G6IMH7_NIADE|nr:hemerythrin domain-containing protein [Niabella drilacis]SDC06956.1 Hemerythrin-like domain-containing protein [Niabella drilacis]